eukprot:2701808-Rhodomonas_salina.5
MCGSCARYLHTASVRDCSAADCDGTGAVTFLIGVSRDRLSSGDTAGTSERYGPTRMVICTVPGMILRASYGMSGTEGGYGGTRRCTMARGSSTAWSVPIPYSLCPMPYALGPTTLDRCPRT